MLIDNYLPDYHFSEKHSIRINASSNHILKAIADLSPNEISVIFRLLFFIRSIPPKILGKQYIGFDSGTPLLKQLEEKGFKILGTNDHEIVLGIVGSFGKMRNGNIYRTDDFKNFNQIGAGKTATNFHIKTNNDKLLLSTETRIYICDKKSKRRFALYWGIVRSGSALIRRIWLKAIKKKAEIYNREQS